MVVTCLHGASSSTSSVQILTLWCTYSVIHTYQNVCLNILGGQGRWHPFRVACFNIAPPPLSGTLPSALATATAGLVDCCVRCAASVPQRWIQQHTCTALNLVALSHLIFVAVSVFISLHSSLPRVSLMRIVVTAVVVHSRDTGGHGSLLRVALFLQSRNFVGMYLG